MTLTELKYIITLSRTLHFGEAAKQCFVSQPTLSVAVKKLEDQLGVAIFERSRHARRQQTVDVMKDLISSFQSDEIEKSDFLNELELKLQEMFKQIDESHFYQKSLIRQTQEKIDAITDAQV